MRGKLHCHKKPPAAHGRMSLIQKCVRISRPPGVSGICPLTGARVPLTHPERPGIQCGAAIDAPARPCLMQHGRAYKKHRPCLRMGRCCVRQTTERRGLPARLEKKNNGGSRGGRKGSLFPLFHTISLRLQGVNWRAHFSGFYKNLHFNCLRSQVESAAV